LWDTAKPFLEKWLKEQIGPKAVLEQLKQNLPFFAEQLPQMPKLMFEVLALQREQLLLNKQQTSLILKANSKPSNRKGVPTGIFASFLIMGILGFTHLIDMQQLSLISLGAAALAGLYLLFN